MKTTLLSLKAFFTICLLCLVGGVNVMADTYTYTFKNGDIKIKDFDANTAKVYNFNNINWEVIGKQGLGEKTSSLSFNNTKGHQLGVNDQETNITFTTSAIPGTITSVKVNASTNKNGSADITVKVGSNDWGTKQCGPTAKDYTFTGNATGAISINLNNTKSKKGLYIKSITVEYTTGNVVSAPIITPTTQEFHKPFIATISPVEGATIYYTIDGSDPRTSTTRLEYTTGVEIPAATTTLKACAVKGEETSSVSSATYTFFPIYENIAALKAVAVNGEKYYVDFKNAVVTYTFNNNAFVEDNSGAAIHVYQNHSLKAGNLLNGTTSVVYSVYSGDNQIKDIDFTKLTITEGANIPVTDVDIETLNANIKQYESKRIRVKKALVAIEGAFDTKKQATLKQGENSIVLYKKGTANMNDVVKNDAIIDIIGYPLVHKASETTATKELTIWAGDDAVASTDKFTITPAKYGTYYTEDAFVMPEGVLGYTITSEDGKTLKFNETYAAGAVVPAKTALVLKATEELTANKEYIYTIVNSTAVAPTDNLLHGSVAEAMTNVEGAKAYYKLANPTEGLGFYYGAENGGAFKNGAHKAYLAVKTEALSQMRGFSFDSMTTGINHVVANAEHAKSTVIYDLNGRRVNSMNAAAKGVYIVNGKKVIVK